MPKIQQNSLPLPFPGNPSVAIHHQTQVIVTHKAKKPPKAGTNGTLISFVLDESGSMSSCYNDTVGGFNGYISNQKVQTGVCHVTLAKFNGGNILKLYENRHINEVPNLDRTNYHPAGGTNLLDAIGETIEGVDEILSNMKKKERPSVLLIIMTDGEENASRRFNNEQIKSMIKAREAADWTFMFLGANIDAFSVASSYGLSAGSTMSYSTTNMAATMATVSASTTRYRSARAEGYSSDEIRKKGLFTDEERGKVI